MLRTVCKELIEFLDLIKQKKKTEMLVWYTNILYDLKNMKYKT